VPDKIVEQSGTRPFFGILLRSKVAQSAYFGGENALAQQLQKRLGFFSINSRRF
jgi:hypothetical protein